MKVINYSEYRAIIVDLLRVNHQWKNCPRARWCNCSVKMWLCLGDTVDPYSHSHRCRGHVYCADSEEICTCRLPHVCFCTESGCRPRPEDGVGGLFWKPVCGVSHRHRGSGGEPLTVLTIIFPFSSHLASLFINIRGTCKLECAETLSFGQECFQRAPCCSERVLSSWLHWTVEQAKRC